MTNIKLTLTRGCQLQDIRLVEEFAVYIKQLVQSVVGVSNYSLFT